MGIVQVSVILLLSQIHWHVKCYSSSASARRPDLENFNSQVVQRPLGIAKLDYSAASEYCEAHYGIKSYFGSIEKRDELIYDARHLQEARLDDCGFELCCSPTSVSDFSQLDQIRKLYIPELRTLISQTLFGDDIDNSPNTTLSPILDIVFWHPMLRGNEPPMEARSATRPSRAPVASMVHMDTDCGAYGLDGILNLIEKNRLDAEPSSPFPSDKIEKALKDNSHRFLLLNIWRPIYPVLRSPLGILSSDYHNTKNQLYR